MEQPYVVPDTWAKTILWVGVASYFTAILTYISKFTFGQIQGTLDNLVIYGFLLLGFLFLFGITLRKAVKVQHDRKDMETPEFFFDKYARMGWACLVIHFLSLYTFDHRTFIYYPLALIGYGLMTMSHEVGVYLLVVFYVFSIARMFTSTINVFYGIQKVLSMLYVLGYGYIFARRYIYRMQQQRSRKEEKTT